MTAPTTPDTKIGARLRARLTQLLAENSRVPTLYDACIDPDDIRERPREQAWNAAFGRLQKERTRGKLSA
jgi:hypothetical protein